MDELYETYGQGMASAMSTASIFGIAIYFFVEGPFAQYLSMVLTTIFG